MVQILLYIFCLGPFTSEPILEKAPPYFEEISIDCQVVNETNVSKEFHHSITHIETIPNDVITFQTEKYSKLLSFSGYYYVGKRRFKIKQKELNLEEDFFQKNYSFNIPKKDIDQITFQYEVMVNDLMHLSHFNFAPYKNYQLSIELPNGLQISTQYDQKQVTLQKSKTGASTVYSFKHKKSTKKSVLHTMVNPIESNPQLHFNQWYSKLIASKLELNDASKKQIDAILLNEANTHDKAVRLFQFVRDEIRYYELKSEDQIFKPINVNQTLVNRNGDCKDFSAFLCAALRYIGMEAEIGLANIGSRKKSYHDFVSLSKFDHALCVVKNGDTYIYLDATEQNGLYGFPPIALQNEEVFLVRDESYEILQVPTPSAEENLIDISILAKVENEHINFSGSITRSGMSAATKFTDELLQSKYYGTETTIMETDIVVKSVFKRGKLREIQEVEKRRFIDLSILPFLDRVHYPSYLSNRRNHHSQVTVDFKFNQPVKVQIQDKIDVKKNGVSLKFKMEQTDAQTLTIDYEIYSPNKQLTEDQIITFIESPNLITNLIKSNLVYEVLD